MRVDLIYGFSVDPEAQDADAPHLLRYPVVDSPWLAFIGVVLASWEHDDLHDAVALDVLNQTAEDGSSVMVTFDEWLENSAEGQSCKFVNENVRPSILVVQSQRAAPLPIHGERS